MYAKMVSRIVNDTLAYLVLFYDGLAYRIIVSDSSYTHFKRRMVSLFLQDRPGLVTGSPVRFGILPADRVSVYSGS